MIKCPFCSSYDISENKGKFGIYYRCFTCKNNISSKYMEKMSIITNVKNSSEFGENNKQHI